jgi:hypothetical protein
MTTDGLTWEELQRAAFIGASRRLRALRADRSMSNVSSRPGIDRWGRDIEAVAAEMLVAKALNVYYNPGVVTDHHSGDVAGMEVRHTEYDHGCLIAYPDDPPARRIVLVVGLIPRLRIAGWASAATAAMDGRWRETDRPGWWLAQEHLLALDLAVVHG